VSGPWDDEPDKAQWVDPATGLDCLVVRNRMGALCGYVGVPPGHPWHGLDYSGVHAQVHGGLTYSAACTGDEEAGVCHVPEPGRPEDVWWLGFDCCHGMDLMPYMVALEAEHDELRGIGSFPGMCYKTFAYVQGEIAQLAQQAAAGSCGEAPA
jgi:hypothetical protein